MGEQEAQLKTALAAIAAENRFIREAHALSEQRLTDLRCLVDKMALDLERDGANLAFNSKSAVDASARACLLYTSPSPRDGLLSRMPSSA